MKKIYLWLLFLIPIIMISIGTLFILSDELKIDNELVVSGQVTEYVKGKKRHKLPDKPAYIIIDNEKYFIMFEIIDYLGNKELLEIFSKDSFVTITYFVDNEYKYIVEIYKDNNIILSIDNTYEAINEYNNKMIFISVSAIYTYALFVVLLILETTNKLRKVDQVNYPNKLYLSKLELFLIIIFGVFLFAGSIVCACLINKWMYLILITIVFIYILCSIKYVSTVYFGNSGFIINSRLKKYHYSWNSIKEIIIYENNNKNIVIINFKEQYKMTNITISSYLKYAKLKKNKFVYTLVLNNTDYLSFSNLYKAYLKKIYNNEYKKIVHYIR